MRGKIEMKKEHFCAAPLRMLCALTLCTALALPVGASSFTDVKDNAWYAEAVEEVVEAGLMGGTSDTTFSPDTAVTRAATITALWHLAGSPEPAGACSFTDVGADMWYAKAVAWAEESGITAGNGKGCFEPQSGVTREELAVFLYQYAHHAGEDLAKGVLSLYRDEASISKWARTAMEHALGAGLLTGSAGKLSPKQAATRGELAVILQKMSTPVMG